MAKSKREKIGVIRCYVGNNLRNRFNEQCRSLGYTQTELFSKLIEMGFADTLPQNPNRRTS